MNVKNISLLIVSAAIVGLLSLSINVLGHEEIQKKEEVAAKIDETHHLEVKPETLEGYRLPYMGVNARIIDGSSGKEETITLHPMFGGNFHYGANVRLEPKIYRIIFHLDPPNFMRSEKRMNDWLSPLEADFTFDASVPFEKNVKLGVRETHDMKVSFEVEHSEKMFALAGTGDEHKKETGETKGFGKQLSEFLPFGHIKNKNGFAALLSIILWISFVRLVYFYIKKYKNIQ